MCKECMYMLNSGRHSVPQTKMWKKLLFLITQWNASWWTSFRYKL